MAGSVMTRDTDVPASPCAPDVNESFAPAVCCLPDRSGSLDRNWQAGLQAQLPKSRLIDARELSGIDRHRLRQPSLADLSALVARIGASGTAHGLLIIRSKLALPNRFGQRLALLAGDSQCPPVTVFPGNHDPRINPVAWYAGSLKQIDIDSLVAAAADRSLTRLSEPPLDIAYVRASSAAAGNSLREKDCFLADDFFILDPDQSLSADPPENLAVGHTVSRVRRLIEEGIDRLPSISQDSKPVSLHITHSWGGGIKRWIADQIRHDTHCHHLVLASVGSRDEHRFGEGYKLYAAGVDRGLIRCFHLCESIADTAGSNPEYRQMLDWLIRRYSVGRVLVSSLIGHSVDSLRTGLPTGQILHDHYPVWPIFNRDPLDYLDRQGRLQLRRAISDEGGRFRFSHTATAHWQALREQWRAAYRRHDVQLIAPSRSVRQRWQSLFHGHDLTAIHVVPHGFTSPYPDTAKRRRRRPSAPLKLLVPGRIAAGKGADLLCQVVDRLPEEVSITLLGAGSGGMAFFGKPRIDIIMDFDQARLPELLDQLQPDAALLLSTVPETWSYTLSECRALGLVPIATRIGSFAERIEHGVDGLLFEPDGEALLAMLARLGKNPMLLAELSPHRPGEPSVAESSARYSEIVPADNSVPRYIRSSEFGLADFRAALQADANKAITIDRLQDRLEALEQDLHRRTTWALKLERLKDDRTRWAQSLQAEFDRARTRLEEIQTELVERTKWARSQERLAAERTEWARKLDAELDELRNRHGKLQTDLEQYQHLNEQLRQEIEQRDLRIESLNAEVARLEEQYAAFARQLAERNAEIQSLQTRLQSLHTDFEQVTADRDRLAAELTLVYQSHSWRYTRWLRAFRRVLTNAGTARAYSPLRWPRLLGKATHFLRLYGFRETVNLMQHVREAPSHEPDDVPFTTPGTAAAISPISIPTADNPQASVIIPVFNKVQYTFECLQSIVEHTAPGICELIVVDDCSSDETAAFLDQCSGIRVLRNPDNQGFIRSCNAGAEAARAPVLVFLNNDTLVSSGWLNALLESWSLFPEAGVVGARLVNADGTLQEAGGLIFSDGSGWNYGRNRDAADPEYNFACETDYVSGACLAIRRDLFRQLQGFDEHFAPAYYEDTDLCFRVRAQGLKVIYQPACRILHHEGISSGTDESSGTKRFQAVNRDKFLSRWRDTLSAHPTPPADADALDHVRQARQRYCRGHVLVIDATTPEPDKDSGSVRMLAILEMLREMGFLVTFAAENMARIPGYTRNLQKRGIQVLYHPWVRDLDPWLAAFGSGLDTVFCSRHYVLAPLIDTIRRFCPGARLVFDTVDLHFLREERKARLVNDPGALRAARKTRDAEVALMRKSDLSLVVSPVEQQLLAEIVPDADVRVLSNIHEVVEEVRPWRERRDIFFIGGFQHPPNIDAADWLVDEIMPALRTDSPDIRLHLIGSRMPERIRQLHAPGIVVHGFVEDVTPFLKSCRLSVAPLRYGAGVKGKVNQAMAWGVPVVATSCAAEGMFLKDGTDVLVANDTRAFAACIRRAYSDENLWNRLSANGQNNVRRYFSRQAARRALHDILAGEVETVAADS